jgi:hypothetical protein
LYSPSVFSINAYFDCNSMRYLLRFFPILLLLCTTSAHAQVAYQAIDTSIRSIDLLGMCNREPKLTVIIDPYRGYVVSVKRKAGTVRPHLLSDRRRSLSLHGVRRPSEETACGCHPEQRW